MKIQTVLDTQCSPFTQAGGYQGKAVYAEMLREILQPTDAENAAWERKRKARALKTRKFLAIQEPALAVAGYDRMSPRKRVAFWSSPAGIELKAKCAPYK